MPSTMKKHDFSGFTLVELMIALAIIGILASIAMVQFDEYMKSTSDKAALADARNLLTTASASSR